LANQAWAALVATQAWFDRIYKNHLLWTSLDGNFSQTITMSSRQHIYEHIEIDGLYNQTVQFY